MKNLKHFLVCCIIVLTLTKVKGQTTPIDNVNLGPHIFASMKNIKVEPDVFGLDIKFDLYLSASAAYVNYTKPANQGGQGSEFALESMDLAFDLELASYTSEQYVFPGAVSAIKASNQIAKIQGLNNVSGSSPAGMDSRFRLSVFRDPTSEPLTETLTKVASVTISLPFPTLSPPDATAKLVLRCAQTGFGTGLSGSKWNDFSGNARNVVGSAAPSKPLPVTLVSFDATQENNIVGLSWKTSEETNSDRFEVQRSANGRGWTTIQTVKALGESKVEHFYESVDAAPLTGNNLYRLQMIDLDGTTAFSRIVSLRFEQEADFVYPNPAVDRLYLKDQHIEKITGIEISNAAGLSVLRLNQISQEGIDVKTLKPGLYNVKVSGGSAVKNFKVAIVK